MFFNSLHVKHIYTLQIFLEVDETIGHKFFCKKYSVDPYILNSSIILCAKL